MLSCYAAQRQKLSHAGPKTVNREAEGTAPTGVGSGDLLLVVKAHIFFRKPRITKTAAEIMLAFSTKPAKQATGFGPDANGCQIW